MRTHWTLVRDREIPALYLHVRPRAQLLLTDPSAAPEGNRRVARTVDLVLSSPAVPTGGAAFADFDADHHLLGVEVLYYRELLPLYVYRQHRRHSSDTDLGPQHRPHHGAPAGPGSQGDGGAAARRAGERLRSARAQGKGIRWRRAGADGTGV